MTPEYKKYRRDLGLQVRKQEIPEGPLQIHFIFGVSNMGFDWDNAIKPTQDVISERLGFNDSRIHYGTAKKVKVPKGKEFIDYTIEAYNEA